MTESDARTLELFPQWIAALADDVLGVASGALQLEADQPGARWLLAGVNYVIMSLDLIPAGAMDLGLMEGALVLRSCVELATQAASEAGAEAGPALQPLVEDMPAVRSFLGEARAEQLGRYVAGLYDVRAHGRSVSELLGSAELRAALLGDVRAWQQRYQAPEFLASERSLIALRSFLQTKLS
jgi:hypothetical protein